MIETRIEGRVRITTFGGAVDGAELLRHAERILNAPDYDPSLHSLVDLRGLTEVGFDSEDVGETDRRYRRAASSGVTRLLAIVATTPLTYGYARAFENQHGETDEIRIFNDMDAARAWLGMTP